MKIYIGCALNGSPESFKQTIEEIKNSMSSSHDDWEILKFVGLGSATPGQVYRTDIGNVESCDLFVAICIYPSIGLGMEIQAAINAKKPILLIGPARRPITRMITDLCYLRPDQTMIDWITDLHQMEASIMHALNKFGIPFKDVYQDNPDKFEGPKSEPTATCSMSGESMMASSSTRRFLSGMT